MDFGNLVRLPKSIPEDVRPLERDPGTGSRELERDPALAGSRVRKGPALAGPWT